jgi:hypothetical protein
MFLLERIIGFGLYMLILLLACLFLVRARVSLRTVLRVYLVFLCAMAFFYKPYITADLYRTYETMSYYATFGFLQFFDTLVVGSSNPLSRLLFYMIGKTGVYALLPLLSALISYSFIFYVLTRTQDRYNISNTNAACVLFFVMTTSMYISVIGGIRMMLALTMILFAYFRIAVEKKFGVLEVVLSLSSLLIHGMSYAAIAVCVLAWLFDAERPIARRLAVGVVFAAVALLFFARFTSVAHGLYEKFLGYLQGDIFSDPWEYLMGALIMALLLLAFYENAQMRREGRGVSETNPLRVSAVLCMAIALCFCFEFTIFYRFGGQLAVLFAMPTLMITLERTEGRSSRLLPRFDFRTLLMLLGIVIAVVSCTRGSLSSLKFFEL